MDVVETARQFWRTRVPASVRDRANHARAARRDAAWRRPRNLGDLRRLEPFSTWGSSRDGPIDRIYINQFIEKHAADVRGRALEVMDDHYIARYGTGVTQVDILDVDESNPKATFYADIVDAPNVPDDTFDCVVLTQVLPLVYDGRAALETVRRILVPGGVMLATTGGISRLAPIESPVYGHWWHYTSMSAKRLAEEVFGAGNAEVETYGNVLAATGFLYGLGLHDLSMEELSVRDPAYEVTIAIRAVKRI